MLRMIVFVQKGPKILKGTTVPTENFKNQRYLDLNLAEIG